MTFRHEPGTGPALVCMHGSAGNHLAYDPLLDGLPGRERYAINMPGRAGTDGPALDTVGDMEAFLSRFLESEVAGDYVLVGHSVGGGVAIEHALRSKSKRLEAIVLLASGARLRVHPSILQLFEQDAAAGTPPPVPPGLFEPGADPDFLAQVSKGLELTPFRSAAADWRASDRFDRMQDLANVRVPALIIAGSKDWFTPPKYAEYLATQISESELHVIEGAGHMLFLERVPQVAGWIEGFMQRRL